MLYPISQLRQYRLRHIGWRLCTEENTNPLRTDKTNNLIHLCQKGFRSSVEQQMGFIKEKDQLRFIQVANFGHIFKQLCQQTQ
ncbi:hypothetical protein D3C73_934190 [compost metagenome]